MKVLLIINQCNPEWVSVPLVGYNFFRSINKLVDVTLVTHERNRGALEKSGPDCDMHFIRESIKVSRYYRIVNKIASISSNNWPLQHALSYPVYSSFNQQVHRYYNEKVSRGDFDIVHSITPILPRYPVKLVNACKNTPFILGPVNGGIPFPPGLKKIARKEFAFLNFLRVFTKLIPGYSNTYNRADLILAGSTHTLMMLKKMFGIKKDHIRLFFENGISGDLFKIAPKTGPKDSLNLLFVGRLVPYKGADILLDAIKRLGPFTDKVNLTIVGDGPEMSNLRKQATGLGISGQVKFTGWISHEEVTKYYKNSDIFCFPSLREFGGAVALEAMACGLPCIVVDYGGIGEYVTTDAGFKIKPLSREYIIKEFSDRILSILNSQQMIKSMSECAIKRASEFEWDRKASLIRDLYEESIDKRLKSPC